ncbi:hypothetical protein DKX38_018990 [Salix brachista]|uniref:inositol-phosphate phosphatase n=1 Tax=Salix brachista TaxID=2182728 RepID=A0A5N5KPN0_9ROSI|nr:hypothetical protein DKX38_018990 [Salix brachista]
MGRSLLFSTNILLEFSQNPRSLSLLNHSKLCFTQRFIENSRCGYKKTKLLNLKLAGNVCTKAALSEIPNERKYPKVGAPSTGPISANHLIQVVETAAKTGAEVVMDAVNKPRNITYKGLTDLVTDTDKMSEAAILEVVKRNFGDHLILGEEGGIIGDTLSDYLWCIDPLDLCYFVMPSELKLSNIAIYVDGTTNFAHGYPSFAVSVGVLFRGNPAAAAVVEFVGGPMAWNTRTFTATAGGGAFCNGQTIHASQTDRVEQSLLVTGFGYEHDDPWATNIELFKEFTDVSRGVRRLGAAAVDMCHVALGIAEAYWEYRLKPWDMAAGVLIVEEAGGTVSRMDGGKFCVFDRSVLVSNGVLHAKYPFMRELFLPSTRKDEKEIARASTSTWKEKIAPHHMMDVELLERIAPATEKLKSKGIDFSLWYKPENYRTDL